MNWRSLVQTRWQGASEPEKRSLSAALVVLALALVWWLALAPALAVWRTANAQRSALDTQLEHMRSLQAQARALQALPKLNATDARRALEESLKPLGSAAQMSAQVDRLTVTLKGVSAPALAQWLSSSRQNAHWVPSEAHLKRVNVGTDAWDGSVVFSLHTP